MKNLTKNNVLISVAFCVMTLCVFGPLELYITNQSELWFSFYEMLKISGIMSVIAITILGGIGLILKGKAGSIYSAVLFIGTLCLYIQGNYLNISYGVLDGRTIDWSAYTLHAVINTTCWIGFIAMLLLFRKKKPDVFKKVSRIVSLFVIAVEILTLGVLLVNGNVLGANEDKYRMSIDHMMEVGSEDNIVIFVLDTFDDPLMDTIMEADNVYYESVFADFTRFTDCAASGATTAAAMPVIISGQHYSDGLSYGDYVNTAFNTDGLYSELKKQDYSVNLYTEGAYVGTGAEGYVDNFVAGTGRISSYMGLTSKYSTFTLFKYMPHVLKQYFWLYTAEFNEYKPGETYIFGDAEFYDTLVTERLRVAGKNNFHLFHLQGPHYPYTINEFAQPDETATREQQARGNLYIVEEYINQMKACGVYENAMIIVTADHGDDENYSAPILFVKERGVPGNYTENDAPVSHMDVHPTLFSYLGKDTGETFFEITENQQRNRLFHLRLQDAGSFYMKEYVIQGKVAEVGRGMPTGNNLSPKTEDASIILGEKMTLGLNGEANRYIISGIETWPTDSVVSSGTESVFSFDLQEIPTGEQSIELEILRTYDESIKQSVTVFVNGQQCHEEEVRGAKTIRIVVPEGVIDSQTIELKLVYAKKYCPIYLSGITIGNPVSEDEVKEENLSITGIIGVPLSALLGWCHTILHNYGLAIILFTLLTKVILFPVSMWVQKNGIAMVKMTPELNRLKIKYYGDKDTIAEETQALYKRENYHPLASTIPMIIQLVMLMGVIGAVKSVMGDADTVLTAVPSETGGLTYLMPLAAGVAALALGLAQNKLNPLQREQSSKEQWMTNGFSIAISLFLGAFVSLGVGIYWIASNLLSIVQQAIMNQVIKPEKYIDYAALEASKKELSGIDDLASNVSKEDKKREKADYKRFFSVANKHLVFYSEKSGFYKYFKDVIEHLLAKSNVIIHYVTSDPKDQIFKIAETQPRIKPYYIGENKLITLMMKMDADIVVMTCPDLDRFHLKRSYVRKDIEYIYMFHYPLSTHMVLNTGALDHYDTIFCVGEFQFDEIRAAERVYGLPEKKLIAAGYGQLEQLDRSYQAMEKVQRKNPKILIAPSWQPDNILDSCIDPMLEQLLDKGYEVVVRPHPEYVKRYKPRMDKIVERYAGREASGLKFELDFTSNNSVFDSDILITDWSGTAYEFSFVTLKPSVFIDTKPKINNPEYVKLGIEPLEFGLRSQVGIQVAPDKLDGLDTRINELLANGEQYADKILSIRNKYIANFGTSGVVGGRYILKQLKERQLNRSK